MSIPLPLKSPHLQRLKTYWEYLSTSLWFLPSLMMLGGLLLAEGALFLDGPVQIPAGPVLGLVNFAGTNEVARDIASNLLAGMMTIASLVFSITMVVLTLAASQFGPRLVRSFMAKGFTQFVLGTYLGTIIYCLIVVFALGQRPADDLMSMPSLSGAVALVAFCVFLLALFLHGLARSIDTETLVETVGREVDGQILKLPENGGPASSGTPARRRDRPKAVDHGKCFGTRQSGYVQAVELEEMVHLAAANDATVGLLFRAGDYVAAGGQTIVVAPRERASDDLADRIRNLIVIGHRRTPVQDPEFSIRHLVEIAVRALSPGINDPYTAAAVVDRLSSSLSLAMARRLPGGEHEDDRGALRVMIEAPSWKSLVGAAFNQIRQNGSSKPLVVIHMLGAIARIADHARVVDQVEPLGAQLQAIVRQALPQTPEKIDASEIKERAKAAQRALDEALARLNDPTLSSR